ncbi:MAG: response regulator transcription factor [Christensenellaceae bacterium]|jgi:two-component system OmpR family response regulator
MANILVVDDNKNLRKLMKIHLNQAGFDVYEAEDGEEALEVIDETPIHLMVVDIMMPVMDGYELTGELRGANMSIPVLMVTAKETIADKKRGFELGADDYMVKPVDMDELVLRVNALLRRAQIVSEHKMTIGSVVLDSDAMAVIRDGQSVTLPQKEFQVLYMLLSYPQKIFTRQNLMDEIWGYESETDPRTVDVHIKRLREKFSDVHEFEIITVRGLGYKAEKYA